MILKQYEKYAIFRYKTKSQSIVPSPEEFGTHLKFLTSAQGLYDAVTWSISDEIAKKKLWHCYTLIAERRFLVFAARLKEFTKDLSDGEFIQFMEHVLPPLDILLVWHAVLSHPKLSFDNFHRYDFLRFVKYPFPLTLIEDAISSSTYKFSPKEEYVNGFEHSFGLEYDSHSKFNPNLKLPLYCPLCLAFIANVSLWDPIFKKNQLEGYFSFTSTCSCFGKTVTPDILRKRRFIKDCNNNRKILPNIVKEIFSYQKQAPSKLQLQDIDTRIKAFKTSPKFEQLSFSQFVQSVKADNDDILTYRILLPYSNMPILPFTIGMKILDYTRSIQKGVLITTILFDKLCRVNWYGIFQDAEKAMERYSKFVALFPKAKRPLIPTLDIEIAWITHQLSQTHFFEFWRSQVGTIATYETTAAFSDSFDYTNDLYLSQYNEQYVVCYCDNCVFGNRITS